VGFAKKKLLWTGDAFEKVGSSRSPIPRKEGGTCGLGDLPCPGGKGKRRAPVNTHVGLYREGCKREVTRKQRRRRKLT